MRFLLIGIVAAVIFTVFAFVDCALTERYRMRGVRKPVWLIIILLFPVVGGLLWLIVGKARPGTMRNPEAAHPNAPDDDPSFLRGLDAEERVRKLEEELARLEDEERRSGSDDGPSAS